MHALHWVVTRETRCIQEHSPAKAFSAWRRHNQSALVFICLGQLHVSRELIEEEKKLTDTLELWSYIFKKVIHVNVSLSENINSIHFSSWMPFCVF